MANLTYPPKIKKLVTDFYIPIHSAQPTASVPSSQVPGHVGGIMKSVNTCNTPIEVFSMAPPKGDHTNITNDRCDSPFVP